ncbi:MAG: hypothetical protein NT069_06645, partial [Planctomycetota bacterium]|nr:hypothetical protein [Planctomycetota bacterium]
LRTFLFVLDERVENPFGKVTSRSSLCCRSNAKIDLPRARCFSVLPGPGAKQTLKGVYTANCEGTDAATSGRRHGEFREWSW